MARAEDEVGKRLKDVRRILNLSQRQLARRCGVANATISQIESGAVNPTVGMLKKILDGIPLSLADFFTFDEKVAAEKAFYAEDELVDIADGGVSYRLVGGNLSGKAIQLMKERYEPGAHTGKHALRHEGEECGIVLSGRLHVTVGGQSKILKAGEAYYFRSDQPHSFQNKGPEPCEVISACSPPSF